MSNIHKSSSMKDYLKNYKNHYSSHTLWIIGISLFLALAINFSFSGTNYGKNLKSSVIDATEQKKNTGDMYLQLTNNGESIGIKSSLTLSQVTKLAFSLSYNPETLKVIGVYPTDSDVTGKNLANTPGYQTTFLVFPTPRDIKAGETIATIKLQKWDNKTTTVNLFSVNTEDVNKNITEFSSSGIDF